MLPKEGRGVLVTAAPEVVSVVNCIFIFPFARFKTFAFQANSFSMFLILNIEYRIRNFEQQKFFKE